MKNVTINKIKISNSGKLMIIDGDVNIRTNLNSLPDWVGSIEYDPSTIEEYRNGKYANGYLVAGLSDHFKEKSKFQKTLDKD